MYRFSDIYVSYPRFSLSIENFYVEKGKILAIVGPNGSGKSTLLNLLAFIQTADSGTLFYKNSCVDGKDREQLLQYRRSVSYLLQNAYLFSKSVYDNIGYGLKLRRVSSRIIEEKTKHMMEQLSLTHLADRKIHTLSGGEAQRVALARTMVISADVYLFDEPTSNIDKDFIRTVEALIVGLNREKGATIIFTTHSREQAYRMSHKIFSIINGKLKNLPYENVFSGQLVEESDGIMALPISDSVTIRLSYPEAERVTVAIDPTDIILSNGKIESSALNSFEGTIKKVETFGDSLQVFVNVGTTVCTLITLKSFHDLGLNIGSKVWVTFKANSVKVI